MSRTTRSIITGLAVFIVVFIKNLFFDPITSNVIINFIISFIIIFMTIFLVDVLGDKASKKKTNEQ